MPSFRLPFRALAGTRRRSAPPAETPLAEPMAEPIAMPLAASCSTAPEAAREPDVAEALPHFTEHGNLVVPFAAPRKFHYWKKRTGDDGDATDDVLTLAQVRAFASERAA